MAEWLFNGDCLEIMPELIKRGIKVDMILCDLPYGTTQNKWDSLIPLDKLWSSYKSIIKDNGAIVLFAQIPFSTTLGASNLPMLRYEWIWKKPLATGFLNANRMPLKNHENILVFYKSLPTYNPQKTEGKPYKAKRSAIPCTSYNPVDNLPTNNETGERYPVDVIEFNADKEKLHPTQKPVGLCEYLIKTYTNEGQLIMDNCMGSGTTGVACKNLNRNFIGIELDKKYFEIAKERIRNG